MRRRNTLKVIALALLAMLTLGAQQCEKVVLEPTVLLIAFDGFRWDYLEKAETPHLDRLVSEGVISEGLIPVFPSKTFPNHYSIVTGLYAEDHGIVANNMYDSELGARFSLSNREAVGDGRWWGGEPIWVTAAKAGKKSATLFWPGSEAEIQGYRPSHWKLYDEKMSAEDRLDWMMRLLRLPRSERPVFVSLYFEDVDTAGHRHGPESPEVVTAIQRLDRIMGVMIDKLERAELLDQINMIIVSDHGMAALQPEQVIVLDEVIDLNRVRVVDWNPVLALEPNGDYFEEAFERLNRVGPQLQVYRKADIPDRLRFRNNRRVPPLIAVAGEGWTITTRSAIEQRGKPRGGNHGYDPALRSMQGLFIARGPAFRRGLRVGSFENVHVYPLMCHLLGLTSAPSDGSLQELPSILANGAGR